MQSPNDGARTDIDDRDLIVRGQGNIGLLVPGKGYAHRFIEAGRLAFAIEGLNRSYDLQVGWAESIVIHYRHRIGYVI